MLRIEPAHRESLTGIVCLIACICSGLIFSAPAVAEDLPRWQWDFATAGEKTVASSRGKSLGTTVGAPKLASDPARLELDGASRVIVHDDIGQADLPTEAITVATWVRVDRGGSWCGFVSAIQDNGAFERGWLVGLHNNRFCFGLTSMGAKRLTYLDAPATIALSAWYHVVGVYDGRRMRLYVDGELVAESNAQRGPILYPPQGIVALGAYVDDNETYPLRGAMASTAIHDRALSSEEVQRAFLKEKSRYLGDEPPREAVVGWPTYRHDSRRSGATNEELTLPLRRCWTQPAAHAPQPAWPPPANQDFWRNKQNLRARMTFDRAFHLVSDGERVYFGSSADDQVRALDLKTGAQVWTFFADGPVRMAPTIDRQHIYFGSDDGCVYCLQADDGKLVWRFDAAGAIGDRRMIPGNRRLISTLPVRTGVLIHDKAARFGAGLFPQQGAYQFALDKTTGKELARGKLPFSPQGYLEQVGADLRIARGRAPKTTFATGVTKRGKVAGKQAASSSVTNIRAGNAEVLGRENEVVVMVAGKPAWRHQVEGNALSLAVAGERLLVSTDQGRIYCFGPDSHVARSNHPVARANVFNSEEQHEHYRDWAKAIPTSELPIAGYALLLGGNTLHAAALAEATTLRIVMVTTNPEHTARARKQLAAAKLYGNRVVVQPRHRVARASTGTDESIVTTKLPFGRWLFNLIVLAGTDEAGQWPAAIVAPHVRPAGGIVVDLMSKDESTTTRRDAWLDAGNFVELASPRAANSAEPIVLRLEALAGQGQWTHMYANSANTSCSEDQQVAGELQLQWFGPPGPQKMVDRHHRTTPPLFCNGRLFVPGNQCVFAVDAYNGAVLWQTHLKGFRRVGAPRDAGNMAATDNALLAVAKQHLHVIDAATGHVQRKFTAQHSDRGERHWGYVSVNDQQIVGSSTWPEASRSGHSRSQISETYYDNVPIVTSDRVFAIDRASGDEIWNAESRGCVVNPTITIGNGRVYFVESELKTNNETHRGRARLAELLASAKLVALDLATGEQLWRAPLGALGGSEHHLYLAYAKQRLVAVGTRNAKSNNRVTVHYDIVTFDASNGKQLWSATQDQQQSAGGSHGEQDHHLAIIGDTIVQEPYRYDLRSGKRHTDWKFARGGHGCGSISASSRAFFFRAGNPTMCDLATGKKSKVNLVSRPGCWINMLPAGGLLLIPEASSGCTCDFPIQSSMAFAPK